MKPYAATGTNEKTHFNSTVFVLLAILLITGGCTSAYQEIRPANGTASSGFVAPVEGTKLTYRTLIDNRIAKQDNWSIVVPEQNFDQPAYALKSGNRMIVRQSGSGNWLATFEGDEKIKSASPDNDQLRFPLWVGKKWMSAYTYSDLRADREWSPTQDFWSVEAVETITVPAGSFEVYRLKSDPGLHSSVSRTIWFSVKLGLEVKRQWERLPDHYLGAQKGVVELVSIKPPATKS